VRIFKEKVQSYGWIEGQTIRFERRKAGTDVDQTKHEAMALVDLKPDVLVASSTVVAAALAERTSDIPIVFLAVADPIQSKFSDSLARPSRNMTGLALSDPAMGGKIVQLLKEVASDLKRVTIIYDPDIGAGRQVLSVYTANARQFASEMGLDFGEAHVHGAREIEESISTLGQGDGLWVGADSTIFANMKLIIELAARRRVPAIYSWPQFVADGGLMSYFVDQAELWRGAADYVNRLLTGTRVQELPIQQPSRYVMSINLATAKALGITIPREVLVRATEVIE
jgi:putative ABC transport system substrate-binding protein